PVPIHFSTKPLQNNTLADLRRNPAVPKAKLSAHPIASKQRRLNHKLSILQRSPQGGGRHRRWPPCSGHNLKHPSHEDVRHADDPLPLVGRDSGWGCLVASVARLG